MNALALAAAVATTLAVALTRPPSGWVVRTRLGAPLPTGPRRRPSWGLPTRLGAGASVLVAAAMAAGPAVVIVTASVVGTSLFAVRQVRLSRARSAAVRRRAEVGTALDLLAAELRGGTLPSLALTSLATDVPSLVAAAVAAEHGGDVVAALQTAGSEPGAEAFGDLAGAWHVAERAGAPLADVLDRVAEHLRADVDVDREVQAEAAPARATGRLMAVLPVLGLTLGAGMGADPVRVLTGTVAGACCLAAGLALACAGLAWVDRIVASADAA